MYYMCIYKKVYFTKKYKILKIKKYARTCVYKLFPNYVRARKTFIYHRRLIFTWSPFPPL